LRMSLRPGPAGRREGLPVGEGGAHVVIARPRNLASSYGSRARSGMLPAPTGRGWVPVWAGMVRLLQGHGRLVLDLRGC
jgi:hypothetical protein